MRYLLASTAFTLSISCFLYAAEPDLTFTNPKVMGMGGAGIALCADDSALYLNPAGLARVKQTQIKGPRLRFEIGQELIDSTSKLSKLQGSQDTSVVQTLIGIDGSSNIAGQLATFASPGFGIGAFLGSDIYSSINKDASYTLKMAIDSGISTGWATGFELFGQKIDGGIGAKLITRTLAYNPTTGENKVEISDSDLVSIVNSSDKLKEKIGTFTASGIGFDIGFLTDTTIESMPVTWGLTFKNIGTSLSGSRTVASQNTTTTVVLPMTTVVGAAFAPELPTIGQIQVAADYTLSPSTSIFKSMHIGAEKKVWGDTVALRCGINQGYIVMGFGVDVIGIKCDYTFFGKEQGERAGDTPDIYHSLQFGILF